MDSNHRSPVRRAAVLSLPPSPAEAVVVVAEVMVPAEIVAQIARLRSPTAEGALPSGDRWFESISLQRRVRSEPGRRRRVRIHFPPPERVCKPSVPLDHHARGEILSNPAAETRREILWPRVGRVHGEPSRWIAEPSRLRRVCDAAVQRRSSRCPPGRRRYACDREAEAGEACHPGQYGKVRSACCGEPSRPSRQIATRGASL